MNPLSELSDAELNEVFSVEVAGCTNLFRKDGASYCYVPGSGSFSAVLPFTTSADAVLPWLDAQSYCVAHLKESGLTRVTILEIGDDEYASSQSATFARAAVIALILAKRAQSPQARNAAVPAAHELSSLPRLTPD